MTTTSLFQSILQWLRAGYPEGVPGPDRVPLLSLLRNTPLTDDQIKEVVREITKEEAKAPPGHEIDRDEIEKFIEGVAHHDGGPDNIRRVAAKLAATGWPLAKFGDRDLGGGQQTMRVRSPETSRPVPPRSPLNFANRQPLSHNASQQYTLSTKTPVAQRDPVSRHRRKSLQTANFHSPTTISSTKVCGW